MKLIQRVVRMVLDQIELAFHPIGRALSVVVALGLLVLWYTVPSDGCLVRPDLLPWTALCTGLILALQARAFGDGPHPQLTPLSTALGQLARRAGVFLAPQLLLSSYDLGAAGAAKPRRCLDAVEPVVLGLLPAGLDGESASAQGMVIALKLVVVALALLVAMVLGRAEGRTAWRPGSGRPLLAALPTLALLVGAAGVMYGAGAVGLDRDEADLLSAGGLASLSFLCGGVLWSRAQDTAQRRAMWEHGSRRGQSPRGSFALASWPIAVALPFTGFALAQLASLSNAAVEVAVGPSTPFFLIAVAMLVWPAPRVVGLSLLLHQVEPTGEAEPGAATDGRADTSPPRGTFKFDPQRVRRVGLSVPWFVPTRDAVVGASGQSVTPLWQALPLDPLLHVLGEAVVPSMLGVPRRREVRVEIRPGDDLAPLAPGDSRERRLTIYTPGPVDPGGERPRWRQMRSEDELIQEVDPSTQTIVLTDGAVIILGAGLVSVLYEVEIGAPLYEGGLEPTNALPQFQDYEAP